MQLSRMILWKQSRHLNVPINTLPSLIVTRSVRPSHEWIISLRSLDVVTLSGGVYLGIVDAAEFIRLMLLIVAVVLLKVCC